MPWGASSKGFMLMDVRPLLLGADGFFLGRGTRMANTHRLVFGNANPSSGSAQAFDFPICCRIFTGPQAPNHAHETHP